MVFVYTKTHLATEIRIAKLLRISLTKKAIEKKNVFKWQGRHSEKKRARMPFIFEISDVILNFALYMQRHKKSLKTAEKIT